jgi:metal-dependent HD superfamily phosphatase/phosphodiesterase
LIEKLITRKDIEKIPAVRTYTKHADEFMKKYGYTEHGERHASLVANIGHNILVRMGYPQRLAELAEIAGFLHDIGNMVSRKGHEQIGALMAQGILKDAGMSLDEIAVIMNAIGNHEEEYGWTCSEIAAALLIADKSDVHMTRVRNPDQTTFDIHDRVNYAAKRSFLRVDEKNRKLTLEIEIDTSSSQVMEYFEIFLSRMVMCRRAAEYLKSTFSLEINGAKML